MTGWLTRRVGLTLVDQCVSSSSNFLTGVVVARLSGAAEFGQYMFAFTVWMVVVGVHRAVITEPVIVTSSGIDDRRALLAWGVSAEILLGAWVSILVAAGGIAAASLGAPFGRLMLALSPWFIPLLVQDHWRAMAFQQRRPALALANDLLFAGVQLVAIATLWLLGWHSAPYIVAAWGMGAASGAVLGFWTFRPDRPRHGAQLFRRLWPVSRWMLADFLTGFASDQAYLVLLVLLLAPVEYGGYRAAFSLIGPTVVLLIGGTNIGLPEASRRADQDDPRALHQYARRLTAVTTACIAAYAALVAVAGSRVLALIYGPEFARFGDVAALVALQYVLMVTTFGQGIALRAAAWMRNVWRAHLLVAVSSLTVAAILVPRYGTIGAGWAAVATGLFYATALHTVYHLELRRPSSRRSDPGSLLVAWTPSVRPSAPSRVAP